MKWVWGFWLVFGRRCSPRLEFQAVIKLAWKITESVELALAALKLASVELAWKTPESDFSANSWTRKSQVGLWKVRNIIFKCLAANSCLKLQRSVLFLRVDVISAPQYIIRGMREATTGTGQFTDVQNELSTANLISSIYKEAESLKALVHKHIVQLFHAFIEGK